MLFALLPTYGSRKSKFWKNGEKKENKNTWNYYYFTNVYHKWQPYDVWFLRYGMEQTNCFVILKHFLPFYTPGNLKNQNFERMKTTRGDILILNMCTINFNHMMYGSWDIKHDRYNFLSFWTIFCPFTLIKTQKKQNFEKMKNAPGNIIILYKCTKNHDHMLHYSWDMMCDRCNSYFLFWDFFPPFYTLNNPQKSRF